MNVSPSTGLNSQSGCGVAEKHCDTVCIIAPIHQFDDVRVFRKEGMTIAEMGFNVILYAKTSTPGLHSGIDVRSVPSATSFIKRLVRPFKLWYIVCGINACVYHLHNPDTLPLLILLKLSGKTVIYDTHEDFSRRILIRNWIPALFRRPIAFLVASTERLSGILADAVIVTQPGLVSRLGRKALLLENAPIASEDVLAKAYQLSLQITRETKVFQCVYAGIVSNHR